MINHRRRFARSGEQPPAHGKKSTESAKNTSKSSVKKTSKDSTKKASKSNAKSTSKNSVKKTSKDSTKKASKDNTKNTLKNRIKKTSKGRAKTRSKNASKNKKIIWMIAGMLIIILMLAASAIFLFLYRDYMNYQEQKKVFSGMEKTAKQVVAQADSKEAALDNLNDLYAQISAHSNLVNISGDVTTASGDEQWNNGEEVTLSLKASCQTSDPFLDDTLTSKQTFAISSTCNSLIMVPSYIKQTGIKGDYTNYVYFYSKWENDTTQRTIADEWKKDGSQSKDGIATLGGYYLVAVRPMFGKCGDIIRVLLEDGTYFDCLIADEKGDDAENDWGHLKGDEISLVEFEVMGNTDDCYAPDFIPPEKWNGKNVCAIINLGTNDSESE